MGTAPLACASLEALTRLPTASVLCVVTQPDRPRGRHLKHLPSAVKTLALEKALPLLQPEKARHPEFLQQLQRLAPDLIVVAAYGQILPQSILDLPRFGCLNVHASLLPKYRGAAPIQWALLNDDQVTGVTIMKMDAGLDTGDILSQETMPIEPQDNAASLHGRLAEMGAQLLVRTVVDYTNGRLTPRPQPAQNASYARKIVKEDGRLDWALPARMVWNRVRAFNPWPVAFTHWSKGGNLRLLKVWEAQVDDARSGPPGQILQAGKSGIVVGCGQQSLAVARLQLEGGKSLTADQFLTGHPLNPGDRWG